MILAPGLQELSIGLHGGGPYGLRLTGGGHQEPIVVAKMHKKSKSRAAGVEIGDILLSVNGVNCQHWTVDAAMNLINSTPPHASLKLHLLRGSRDTTLMDTDFDLLAGQHQQTATAKRQQAAPPSTMAYDGQQRQPWTPQQSNKAVAIEVPLPTYHQIPQWSNQQHSSSASYSSQLSTVAASSSLPGRSQQHISAVSLTTHRPLVASGAQSFHSGAPVTAYGGQLEGSKQNPPFQTSQPFNSGKSSNSDETITDTSGGQLATANSWSYSSHVEHPSGSQNQPKPWAGEPLQNSKPPLETWSAKRQQSNQDDVLGSSRIGSAVPPVGGANTWKPLMWRPSGSLAIPSALDVPRPISAPPISGGSRDYLSSAGDRYEDLYDDGAYGDDDDNTREFRHRNLKFDDYEEVVIWSSKVNEQPRQDFGRKLDGPETVQHQPIFNSKPVVDSKVDITPKLIKDSAALPKNVMWQPPPVQESNMTLQSNQAPAPRVAEVWPDGMDVVPVQQSLNQRQPNIVPSQPTVRPNSNRQSDATLLQSDLIGDNYQREESSSPPPYFLTRVVVGGDPSDHIVDYEHKKKKMFADSSFYEDPDQKYPTIEEQIKMARQVARLLTSENTRVTGRGQQMFLKRQQQSTGWKAEPAPVMPHRRRTQSVPPEPPTRTPTSLEVLERLRLREAKTRHDVLPPSVFVRIADELKRTSSTGETIAGRMFAKRRTRSEQYVVPEVPAPRPNFPMQVEASAVRQQRNFPQSSSSQPTARQNFQPPQLPVVEKSPPEDDNFVPRLKRMIELQKPAMTPWEAAERYGRLDPAFEHISAYRAASTWTIADPDDEELKDLEATEYHPSQQSTYTENQQPPSATRVQVANNFDNFDHGNRQPLVTHNYNQNNNTTVHSSQTTLRNPLGDSWSHALPSNRMDSLRLQPPSSYAGGQANNGGYRSVQFHAPQYH